MGMLLHSDDASSIDDRIKKADAQDFHMAMAALLPAEVGESIEFISTTSAKRLRSLWDSQLKRVADYLELTSGSRRIRGNAAHPAIKSSTGKMKYIAITALLGNYDVRGASRMAQFAYGCPWRATSPRKASSHGALP